MQTPGRRAWIGLAIAAGVVGLACLAVLGFFLYVGVLAPIVNTEYAPGFSEKAFSAVEIGDTEAQVLDLLGEPLERDPSQQDPSYVYLRYSRARGRSDTHRARIILLRDGRVTRVWHEVYVD